MILPLALATTMLSQPQQGPNAYFEAPAGKEYAKVVAGGTTILPNGRFLTPKGKRLYTTDDLWNVALRPDGKVVIGFGDSGLVIYPTDSPAQPGLIARRGLAPKGVFTTDGKSLVISNGDEGGGISVYDSSGWDKPFEKPETGRFKALDAKPLFTITADEGKFKDSYINDLVLSPDQRFVYGVDVCNQRVVVFDLEQKKVMGSENAGRQPYAIVSSADGKRLFVANIGIFDYSLIPPPRPGSGGNRRGLSRPPFPFPSKESETGIEMEGRFVPGLGSPYVPDAQSVFVYEVGKNQELKRTHQVKAGILIHAPADGGKSVGGSAPNALLQLGKMLYVSNANNDTVQIFRINTMEPIATVKLAPSPALAKYRGVIPSGMAINKKGTRLYVCESGINAVAVIDAVVGKVVGHIPTGWFPTQVALSPDENTLYIATQKGIGRGPQSRKAPRLPEDERSGFSAMPGMIDAVAVPTDVELKAWTTEVIANNGMINQAAKVKDAPKSVMPYVAGKPSDQIKHVVFITKENHTFDGIFGGLKGAKGDPDAAEFGMQGWIREKGKAERVPIMPNHIRLAEQFAVSDNFYMEPQASGDGHRWLVGVYPSLWTTRVFYSGWQFRRTDAAKGRLLPFGSDGSQFPEDYLENGSIWEHLHRNNITFRNYGEGYEMPHSDEGVMTNKTGLYAIMNHPMPKVLWDNTCFDFPSYNTNIPDIAKADWFIEDLEKNYRKKGKPIPKFLNIALSNDHGAGARPKEGYPYTASYMADNDLALGRVVEYLSHLPEWKSMAIFVTQDDSGGDDDHIDRHRSFVLAIGPYVKRGFVSNVHTSIMSIIKSIYLMYGLGPNNMFDAVASDLRDMFTTTPDFTPYTHVPSDRRVFRPEETFDPSDPEFKRRRMAGPPIKMDDPKFVEALRNQKLGPIGADDDDDDKPAKKDKKN